MLTRCPRCETTFRVTPEQLKARLGRVRCGHCQNVFNALDTLIEAMPPPVPAEALQEPLEEASPATAAEIGDTAAPSDAAEPSHEDESAAFRAIAANDEVVSTPESASAEESLPHQAAEEIAEPEPAEALAKAEPIEAPAAPEPVEAFPESGSPEAQAELPPESASSDEPLVEDTPAFEPELHDAPATQRAWPWAAGAALALAVLLLQAALHFRTELAVLYPGAKPLLEAVCSPFGCDVPLPRKPELVGIEASSLSPDAANRLSLSATLRNRAPFAQQYPNLELTLTDTTDQPLVRRVLVPADYLPAGIGAATGIGPGAELAVNLVVDAPGVPAAGYQLYLFYP